MTVHPVHEHPVPLPSLLHSLKLGQSSYVYPTTDPPRWRRLGWLILRCRETLKHFGHILLAAQPCLCVCVCVCVCVFVCCVCVCVRNR